MTDKGCSGALAAAMMGDEFFMDAIDKADPDSYAINCSGCDTYYVGNVKILMPENACCPNCASTKGSFESPALGSGPNAGLRRKEN